MKQLMALISGLVLTGTAGAQSIGPAALNAAGGSGTIGGNTFEYAIGDPVAGNTFTSSGLVVTPGVLQPAVSQTGISAPGITAAELTVFPNPSDRALFLQPHFGREGQLTCQLLDATGRIVLRQTAHLSRGDERQELPIAAFAAGQYLLEIRWTGQGSSAAGAYKIQKLH